MESAGSLRRLQLCLAALWLIDGVLGVQAFMFSRGFARMLAAASAGNPKPIAEPISWSASQIAAHPATASMVIAGIQVLIGLGIAWRPCVKVALAVSVPWALAVWWLGEGFGGLFAGTANPVTGGPGAVLFYAVLAVLLWPAGQVRPAAFAAGRVLGARAARALWAVLWSALAALAAGQAIGAPRVLADSITAMAPGQPPWMMSLDGTTGRMLAQAGWAAGIVLAVVLAVIAAGVFLPPAGVRAVLCLAVVVAGALWVAGQNLGGILSGTGTDPNSAPLLALLAAAYWPTRGQQQEGALAVPATPADMLSASAPAPAPVALAGPAR